METGFFIEGGMVQGLGMGLSVQPQWVAPKMENKWVKYSTGYNPPGYYRDSLGVVRLRGLVKGGNSNKAMFTLPVGYRPAFQQLHPVSIWANTIGRVDIKSNGQVWASKVPGPPSDKNIDKTWVSLDGIAFRVAD